MFTFLLITLSLSAICGEAKYCAGDEADSTNCDSTTNPDAPTCTNCLDGYDKTNNCNGCKSTHHEIKTSVEGNEVISCYEKITVDCGTNCATCYQVSSDTPKICIECNSDSMNIATDENTVDCRLKFTGTCSEAIPKCDDTCYKDSDANSETKCKTCQSGYDGYLCNSCGENHIQVPAQPIGNEAITCYEKTEDTNCHNCATGKCYINVPNDFKCAECASGSVQVPDERKTGGTIECYEKAADTNCNNCNTDKCYTESAGTYKCSKCAGNFVEGECNQCKDGFIQVPAQPIENEAITCYEKSEDASCAKCATGKCYINAPNDFKCTECASGSVQVPDERKTGGTIECYEKAADTNCNNCNTDKCYTESAGTYKCSKCAGNFVEGECNQCKDGFIQVPVQPNEGDAITCYEKTEDTNCANCATGKCYINALSDFKCAQCAKDNYDPEGGCSSCKSGFIEDAGSCVSCSTKIAGCKLCVKENENIKCTECLSGDDVKDNACPEECDPSAKPSNCELCFMIKRNPEDTNPTATCTKCEGGYGLKENYECELCSTIKPNCIECSLEDGKTGLQCTKEKPEFQVTISIAENKLNVGQIVTSKITSENKDVSETTFSYAWKMSETNSNANGNNIEDSQDKNTYTLTASVKDKYVFVEVTYNGDDEKYYPLTAKSNVLGPITQPATGVCVNGQNGCKECSSDKTQCTTCDDFYVKDGAGCVITCSSIDNCNDCEVVKSGDQNTLKCKGCSGNYELVDNKCELPAVPGECSNYLKSTCKQCKSDDKNYCEMCLDDYGLRNGVCTKCQNGFFIKGDQNCMEDCSIIPGCKQNVITNSEKNCKMENNELLCIHCDDDYEESKDLKSCIKKIQKCSDIIGCEECYENLTCSKCSSLYNLDKETGICNCNGIFIDDKCVEVSEECDNEKLPNCKYCSKDNSICYRCKDEYYPQNDKCLDVSYQCDSEKLPNCYMCTKDFNQCIVCQSKYGFENGKCVKCAEDVPNHSYDKCPVTTCSDTHCKYCDADDHNYCYVCEENYEEDDGKCLSKEEIACPNVVGCSKCTKGKPNFCIECNKNDNFTDSVIKGTCVCKSDFDYVDGKCVVPIGPYVPPEIDSANVGELTPECDANECKITEGSFPEGTKEQYKCTVKSKKMIINDDVTNNKPIVFDKFDITGPVEFVIPDNKQVIINVPADREIIIQNKKNIEIKPEGGKVTINMNGDDIETPIEIKKVTLENGKSISLDSKNPLDITNLQIFGVSDLTGKANSDNSYTKCSTCKVESGSTFTPKKIEFSKIQLGLNSVIDLSDEVSFSGDKIFEVFQNRNQFSNIPITFTKGIKLDKSKLKLRKLEGCKPIPDEEKGKVIIAQFPYEKGNEQSSKDAKDSCDKMEFSGGDSDFNTKACENDEKNNRIILIAKNITKDKDDDGNKLSAGAIAGIVIACVVVVAAIIALLVYFLVIKKKNNSTTSTQGDSSIAI